MIQLRLGICLLTSQAECMKGLLLYVIVRRDTAECRDSVVVGLPTGGGDGFVTILRTSPVLRRVLILRQSAWRTFTLSSTARWGLGMGPDDPVRIPQATDRARLSSRVQPASGIRYTSFAFLMPVRGRMAVRVRTVVSPRE
jgi:hypothetical protein